MGFYLDLFNTFIYGLQSLDEDFLSEVVSCLINIDDNVILKAIPSRDEVKEAVFFYAWILLKRQCLMFLLLNSFNFLGRWLVRWFMRMSAKLFASFLVQVLYL